MPNTSGPGRFTFDEVTNALLTTGGGGGGGDVNITGINGSPPALSNPLPVELSDGTNAVGTSGNPLYVTVTGGGGAPVMTLDSTNSTSTPLLNSTQFIGSAKATTGYATILVAIFTDQFCELQIEFGPDGTNWDQSTFFNYVPTGDDEDQPSFFIPVSNAFYRLTLSNNSGSDQTVLRMEAFLCSDNRVVTMSSETQVSAPPPPGMLQVGGLENNGGYCTALEFLNGHLIIEQGYINGNPIISVANGVQKVGIVGVSNHALDSDTAGVLDENIKNIGNAAVVSAASGIQKVGISGATGTALDGTTAGVLDENLKNVGGAAVATVVSGVQKVGVVGVAGGAFDTAVGSSAPPNSLQVGVIASTALPTASTVGTLPGVMADKYGRPIVLPQAPRDIVGVQTTQIASTTSETTIVTQAGSIFNDITGLQITNQTAIAVTVTIKDSTSGTTRKVYDLAPNGGIVVHFSPPLPQAAVNTNWTATLSVNTVTVDVNVDFVKNK